VALTLLVRVKQATQTFYALFASRITAGPKVELAARFIMRAVFGAFVYHISKIRKRSNYAVAIDMP